MARMWPRQIPPDVLQNPRRSTEVDVYRRLSHGLGDDWWVFYSRPWLGLSPSGEEKDGECDFVVAHARFGVLCLEVKGGAVAWNAETGQWTSRDRDGITHKIKDPVEQARSAKHQLIQRLKQVASLRRRWIVVRHGVVLPGAVDPGRDLGLDRPRRIFCFCETYEKRFEQWISARLKDAGDDQRKEELGQDGLEALRVLLASSFQLRAALGSLARADERELDFLTQQQFHLLEVIRELPRALVHGGAGTGKTVLAIHLARTLAESGLQTLLVCYNRPLADHMAALTTGVSGLVVQSLHQLCRTVVGQAGRTVPHTSTDRDFFDEALPAAATECASHSAVRKFDALIVDEGQDFKDDWWLVLEELLKSGDAGILRVFADNNQRVYADTRRLKTDLQLAPISLSWNLRNTRAIHSLAYLRYQGVAVRCEGPAGETPTLIEAADRPAIVREVVRLVRSLIREHAVNPREIAVLASNDVWRTDLARAVEDADLRVTEAPGDQRDSLVIDTFRRFKGLEALVTILVVDASLTANDELAYVALSRAKTRVFIIGQDRHMKALTAS